MKALLSIALLGLLATQEPMDAGEQQRWRIVYAVLATLGAASLVWIWWPRAPRA